eukprot:g5929.t1
MENNENGARGRSLSIEAGSAAERPQSVPDRATQRQLDRLRRQYEEEVYSLVETSLRTELSSEFDRERQQLVSEKETAEKLKNEAERSAACARAELVRLRQELLVAKQRAENERRAADDEWRAKLAPLAQLAPLLAGGPVAGCQASTAARLGGGGVGGEGCGGEQERASMVEYPVGGGGGGGESEKSTSRGEGAPAAGPNVVAQAADSSKKHAMKSALSRENAATQREPDSLSAPDLRKPAIPSLGSSEQEEDEERHLPVLCEGAAFSVGAGGLLSADAQELKQLSAPAVITTNHGSGGANPNGPEHRIVIEQEQSEFSRTETRNSSNSPYAKQRRANDGGRRDSPPASREVQEKKPSAPSTCSLNPVGTTFADDRTNAKDKSSPTTTTAAGNGHHSASSTPRNGSLKRRRNSSTPARQSLSSKLEKKDGRAVLYGSSGRKFVVEEFEAPPEKRPLKTDQKVASRQAAEIQHDRDFQPLQKTFARTPADWNRLGGGALPQAQEQAGEEHQVKQVEDVAQDVELEVEEENEEEVEFDDLADLLDDGEHLVGAINEAALAQPEFEVEEPVEHPALEQPRCERAEQEILVTATEEGCELRQGERDDTCKTDSTAHTASFAAAEQTWDGAACWPSEKVGCVFTRSAQDQVVSLNFVPLQQNSLLHADGCDPSPAVASSAINPRNNRGEVHLLGDVHDAGRGRGDSSSFGALSTVQEAPREEKSAANSVEGAKINAENRRAADGNGAAWSDAAANWWEVAGGAWGCTGSVGVGADDESGAGGAGGPGRGNAEAPVAVPHASQPKDREATREGMKALFEARLHGHVEDSQATQLQPGMRPPVEDPEIHAKELERRLDPFFQADTLISASGAINGGESREVETQREATARKQAEEKEAERRRQQQAELAALKASEKEELGEEDDDSDEDSLGLFGTATSGETAGGSGKKDSTLFQSFDEDEDDRMDAFLSFGMKESKSTLNYDGGANGDGNGNNNAALTPQGMKAGSGSSSAKAAGAGGQGKNSCRGAARGNGTQKQNVNRDKAGGSNANGGKGKGKNKKGGGKKAKNGAGAASSTWGNGAGRSTVQG